MPARIDSFRYLPRSFRATFAETSPFAGGAQTPVWAPFRRRLACAAVTLLTSAGMSLRHGQEPFDVDRERREPTWGDPGWRPLPADVTSADLLVTHLHINTADLELDHNIALPTDALAGLVRDGIVGASTRQQASVMGYQEAVSGLMVGHVSVSADQRDDGLFEMTPVEPPVVELGPVDKDVPAVPARSGFSGPSVVG